MNDHVRPCNLKPQRRDLTPVLHRPVELAANSGHRAPSAAFEAALGVESANALWSMQIPKIMVAIVVSAGSLCGGQKPMFGFSRRQLFKTLAAIFCILGISWFALDYFVPSPPSKITIATAFKGSTFVPHPVLWTQV